MAPFLPFVCTDCGARGGSYQNSGFEPHHHNCPLYGMVAPVDAFLPRNRGNTVLQPAPQIVLSYPVLQIDLVHLAPLNDMFQLRDWQPLVRPADSSDRDAGSSFRARTTRDPVRVSVPRRHPVLRRRWCL